MIGVVSASLLVGFAPVISAQVDVTPIDSALEQVTCEIPTNFPSTGVTLGRVSVELTP